MYERVQSAEAGHETLPRIDTAQEGPHESGGYVHVATYCHEKRLDQHGCTVVADVPHELDICHESYLM